MAIVKNSVEVDIDINSKGNGAKKAAEQLHEVADASKDAADAGEELNEEADKTAAKMNKVASAVSLVSPQIGSALQAMSIVKNAMQTFSGLIGVVVAAITAAIAGFMKISDWQERFRKQNLEAAKSYDEIVKTARTYEELQEYGNKLLDERIAKNAELYEQSTQELKRIWDMKDAADKLAEAKARAEGAMAREYMSPEEISVEDKLDAARKAEEDADKKVEALQRKLQTNTNSANTAKSGIAEINDFRKKIIDQIQNNLKPGVVAVGQSIVGGGYSAAYQGQTIDNKDLRKQLNELDEKRKKLYATYNNALTQISVTKKELEAQTIAQSEARRKAEKLMEQLDEEEKERRRQAEHARFINEHNDKARRLAEYAYERQKEYLTKKLQADGKLSALEEARYKYVKAITDAEKKYEEDLISGKSTADASKTREISRLSAQADYEQTFKSEIDKIKQMNGFTGKNVDSNYIQAKGGYATSLSQSQSGLYQMSDQKRLLETALKQYADVHKIAMDVEAVKEKDSNPGTFS